MSENITNPTPEATPQQEEPQTTGVVKANGNRYRFAVPAFRMPGSDEIISAEDAATDKDIVKKLLAIEGQGILIQIF